MSLAWTGCTVALSSLMVIISISRQSRINREVETAVVEVQKVLEKIKLSPFDNVTARFPPGYTANLPMLNKGKITVNYADPDVDPLVVLVDSTRLVRCM